MKRIYPATVDQLHGMLEFVRNSAIAAGLLEDQIGQVELAAEEAFINIIKYAYPDNSLVDRNVEIDCRKPSSGRGIEIVIRDRGIPFDPIKEAPKIPNDVPIDKMPIGGYGIHLIENMVDNLSYRRTGDYNELTLVKLV